MIETPAIIPFVPYGLPNMKDPIKVQGFLAEQLDDYSKMGVTSIVSMGLYVPTADMLAVFEKISNEDPTVRHFVFIAEHMTGLVPENATKGYGNDYFRYKGIKYWYDGSPYTETMLLDEPYLHNEFTQGLGFPEGVKGNANWDKDKLIEAMIPFHKEGWQIATHTQGDKASKDMLDVMQEVVASNDNPDPRHRLEHLVLIEPNAYKVFKEMGVAPSFHIHHLYWYGDILKNYLLGKDRVANMLAINTAFEAGHKPSIHSDRPMYRSTPLSLIETAVNRKTKEGYTIGSHEAITTIQALETMTINAAWQVFEENNIGSLEAGKFADMIVVNENPLAVAVDQIGNIAILETYINGRQVYKNDNPDYKLTDVIRTRHAHNTEILAEFENHAHNCACSEMIELMHQAYQLKLASN